MADSNWKDIGRDILQKYIESEKGGKGKAEAGQFGVDIFNNGFEDEFPGDNEDPAGGTYQGYSIEANRASESRPWGGKFGDRPKIHELNQPEAAQALGWRVIDFYPNRDFKSEFYRLAGTPSELRIMMQIVQATRFITGGRINFEQWFEQWEKGFPECNQNRSDSNFLLTGEKQWERIKNPKSRPRYKELTKSQQRADWGYRVIEYWRDRTAEADSVILSGTDLQLIQHIIQIEYEGGGSQGFKAKSHQISVKGQPIIRLYFEQNKTEIEKRADGVPYPQLTGDITFRIMDKTDDPKSNLAKISSADLKGYAKRIEEQFGGKNPFFWEKGRRVLSYNSPAQGFARNWYQVQSKQNGQQLITKLLAVAGLPLKIDRIRWSEAIDENAAFPRSQRQMQVLGQTVYEEVERRDGRIKLVFAEVLLAKLTLPIRLVERGIAVYDK